MTSGDRMRPFPFIVACGRSGTTLLRAMLERGGQIAIPPESYFPVSLQSQHERSAFDPAAFATDLGTNVRFREWGMPVPDLSGVTDYADAVRSVYAAYAASHGADRYGDKTPPFVLHMDMLAELFPEARFVHVIRDGRDVARSLVQTSFGPNRLARAAEVWQRRVTAGRASGARLVPGRYLEIRYEALVAETEPTLLSVCTFLELEFVDEMLHPEDAQMLLPEGERPHHANLERPVTPGLRDWRRDMPDADVALVEAVAGDLLSELGYERRFPKVPLVARGRAVASRARSAVTRSGRRTARSVVRR